MKVCILAALLAFGCKSAKEAAPGGSAAAAARPSVTDPLGFCERASAMMMARRKCFPEDSSIKMGLDGIADLENGAPADAEGRRHVAAQCAVMLDGMMRAEQPKNCPLDVTDDERRELAAFMTAWYGERTAAPTTGNVAADTAVAKLAERRDAACACKDLTCARSAGTGLDADLAALPSDTSRTQRDAAAKMIDEVARCRQKLAYGTPAP
jgi:hypothetical protein